MAEPIIDGASRNYTDSGTLSNKAANARLGFGGVPIGREILRQTGEVRQKYTDPSSPGIPSGPGGQQGWIDVGSDAWRNLRGGQAGLTQSGRGMQGAGGSMQGGGGTVDRARGAGEIRTGSNLVLGQGNTMLKYDDPKLAKTLRDKAEAKKYNFMTSASTAYDPNRIRSTFEYGSPDDIRLSSLANPWSGIRGLGAAAGLASTSFGYGTAKSSLTSKGREEAAVQKVAREQGLDPGRELQRYRQNKQNKQQQEAAPIKQKQVVKTKAETAVSLAAKIEAAKIEAAKIEAAKIEAAKIEAAQTKASLTSSLRSSEPLGRRL